MTPATLEALANGDNVNKKPMSTKERYKKWYYANKVGYNRKRRERYRTDEEYRSNIKINNYYAAAAGK